MARAGLSPWSRRARLCLATLALVASAGCTFTPLRTFTPVQPGRPVALAPDEGLLIIHTSSPWGILELDAGIRSLGRRLAPGEHLRLVWARAGEYRWSRLSFETGMFRWTMRTMEGPMWSFRVEPGVINYPGQIVLEQGRNLGLDTARAGRSVNRSAAMLELLEAEFPRISRQLPLVYTGHIRDEFLDHYSKIRVGRKRQPVQSTALAEPGAALPFFRPARTRQSVVSPDGRYAAFRRRKETREDIYIYAPDAEGLTRTRTVASRWPRIRDMFWADDDTLLIQLKNHLRLVDVSLDDGKLVLEEHVVLEDGYVVDALPNHPESLLFATPGRPARVYRVPLPTLRRLARDEIAPTQAFAQPVAELGAEVWSWLADAQGRVRAAVVYRGDPEPERELWFRSPDGKWKVVDRRPADDEGLIPLGFQGDRQLLVASDEGRDLYALYEFDPASGERGRVVYEHPSAQVVDTFFDHSGSELLGVTTFQGGERVYEFLDSADGRYQRVLDSFPGESTFITSLDRNASRVTTLVTSPSNPGLHYFLDLESGQRKILGRLAPWLRDTELATAEVFSAESPDGLSVEALLSLPRGAERPPLIVMPHGGPVHVRDEWEYDPAVQYLTQRGFAVLKVNYRGSSGYGRSFLEAGKGQWGMGIEDDIEAAVQQLLVDGRVDAERICIFGGSYGGYSALMSVIRFPERYRCAASYAGVTDIRLQFNSSDFALSEWGRGRFAELVGDPTLLEDSERMRRMSPVYRADEIGVPVLLAHGPLDRRVDIEHSERMRTVLELYAKPVEWIPLPGAAHGFADPKQEAAFYERLADFFEQHLSPAP